MSLPSHKAWSPWQASLRQGQWIFWANTSLVVSTLHSFPKNFWVLGSLKPTLQPPITAVDVPMCCLMLSINFHFHARHRRDHSQWTSLPKDLAWYATTNPPMCCFLAALCLSLKSCFCCSFLWFRFCMGEKAPHSVEIHTFWGRCSETLWRVFLSPSGVVKSCPLNRETLSADNPWARASLVSAESGAQATSIKNNRSQLATSAHCVETIVSRESWILATSVSDSKAVVHRGSW